MNTSANTIDPPTTSVATLEPAGGVTLGKPNAKKSRFRVEKMLAQIAAAHKAGKYKKAKHLSIEYLRSFDARYVAVLEAYNVLKPRNRPARKSLPAIARGLDAWMGTQEVVILRLKEKEKSPGDYRDIKEFGIENKALQYLVLWLLKVQANLHPNQYGMIGTHAALIRVAELMTQGYVWAMETDLKDCYPSFDGEKIQGFLPLPKKVTQHIMCCAPLNISLGDNGIFGPGDDDVDDEDVFPELYADARRGIPQGSAASPFAVEMLLSSVFDQLPACGEAVGYADNTLAMAKSEGDVVSMNKALWSALKAHPAGHLRPKQTGVYSPGQPIDFLGHRLTLQGNKVRIEPTPENLAKYRVAVERGCRRIVHGKSSTARAKRARELRGYIRSWCAAFKLWDEAGVQKAKDFGRISKIIESL
jgi:hypothetical protein